MIFSNLIIYNKLILFSENNIRPDEIRLEINLGLNRMMYSDYKLHQIILGRLSLRYILIFFNKIN